MDESVRGSTSEKAEYRDLFFQMTAGNHRLADGTTVKIRGSSSMGDLQASSSMGDLHARFCRRSIRWTKLLNLTRQGTSWQTR